MNDQRIINLENALDAVQTVRDSLRAAGLYDHPQFHAYHKATLEGLDHGWLGGPFLVDWIKEQYDLAVSGEHDEFEDDDDEVPNVLGVPLVDDAAVTAVAEPIVTQVLETLQSLEAADGDEDQMALDLAQSATTGLPLAVKVEVFRLLGLDDAWASFDEVEAAGLDGTGRSGGPYTRDDLRAGPWKSGYGEYPYADEIYDLTHSSDNWD